MAREHADSCGKAAKVIVAVLIVLGIIAVLACLFHVGWRAEHYYVVNAVGMRGYQVLTTNITVTGTANVSVAPNTAFITFSVTTNATNATESARANAKTSANVRSVLLAIGYGNSSVTTNYYSVYPVYCNYYYPLTATNGTQGKYPCNPQSIIGYQTVQSFTLNTSTINSTGSLLDKITAAGGNAVSISGVSFGLNAAASNAAQNQALQAAMKDASTKAGSIAAAANEEVYRLISVSQQVQQYGIYPYYGALAAATPQNAGAPTQITPGKIIVEETVQAVFSARA
jgi:hypothetical protein